MNDTIDLEYTAIERPLPPTIPFREVRQLAESVNNLTFGQSSASRIVLDWLNVVAPVEEAKTDER